MAVNEQNHPEKVSRVQTAAVYIFFATVVVLGAILIATAGSVF